MAVGFGLKGFAALKAFFSLHLEQTLLVGAAPSQRMPLNLANTPTSVDELIAGKDLRGGGAAPTGKEPLPRKTFTLAACFLASFDLAQRSKVPLIAR